jgi:DNA-binding NarL/FixJ family response regulator
VTRLLVVEDNAILASTLVRFLRDQGDLTIVGVATTAEAALKQLETLVVDLVLVDVALPAMSGIDLVAIVHKRYPELPCLMLSGHNEIDYVRRALAAGAKGYVVKSSPLTILAAVKRVLAGEIYLSDELRRKLYH